MQLRPTRNARLPPAEEEAKTKEAGDGDRDWRWAVVHFPCLEGVVPRGQIIMVSDKRHIPEARRRYPDLPLWHEKELALFGEQMDSAGLDEQALVAVNRLKLKTRGWFMGVQDGAPAVTGSGHTA